MEKMTREELQHLLDSYTQETGHIKEWQIDQATRLRNQASYAGKSKTIEQYSKAGKIGGPIGGPIGGKVQGKINVDSGLLQSICVDGGNAAQKIVRTCPHCKSEQKGSIYYRNHGDNCKLKEFIPQVFIDQVNEGFSIAQLARAHRISRTYTKTLIAKYT
tara:strand:+ start:1050 stop:1529 length:480 start_codon:yes stop_codon:yes gene_type:complete